MGGGIVKAEWLVSYTPEEKPEKFDTIVQSWDTANKESELADYSVCTTWGVKNKKVYLLHVLRKRMQYPDLKRAVVAQAEAWDARAVLIEDKASGTQLIQELKQSLSKVKGIKSEGDKVMRMLAQTPEIENGHVLLPKASALVAGLRPGADDVPEGQVRRPGRLDRPSPEVDHGGGQGAGTACLLPNGSGAARSSDPGACLVAHLQVAGSGVTRADPAG